MARPPQVAGGRVVVVCVRLSQAEASRFDALRGKMSRSHYLRYLVFAALKKKAVTDVTEQAG
jgi:hypothetical protein